MMVMMTMMMMMNDEDGATADAAADYEPANDVKLMVMIQ